MVVRRSDLQPALRGLSFEARGGEKIGLVGRTGAGKSSVAVCLFRMAPLLSGRVLVDGVDVAAIGLRSGCSPCSSCTLMMRVDAMHMMHWTHVMMHLRHLRHVICTSHV